MMSSGPASYCSSDGDGGGGGGSRSSASPPPPRRQLLYHHDQQQDSCNSNSNSSNGRHHHYHERYQPVVEVGAAHPPMAAAPHHHHDFSSTTARATPYDDGYNNNNNRNYHYQGGDDDESSQQSYSYSAASSSFDTNNQEYNNNGVYGYHHRDQKRGIISGGGHGGRGGRAGGGEGTHYSYNDNDYRDRDQQYNQQQRQGHEQQQHPHHDDYRHRNFPPVPSQDLIQQQHHDNNNNGYNNNNNQRNGSKITCKIRIPVEQYPGYNFVGLIIGPRGRTQKDLQTRTDCQIVIKGEGSIKEGGSNNKHRSSKQRRDVREYNLDEPLHVEITGFNRRNVNTATEMIRQLLVVMDDNNNVHKRKQLQELASLVGGGDTRDYQCFTCREMGHRSFECPTKRRLDEHDNKHQQQQQQQQQPTSTATTTTKTTTPTVVVVPGNSSSSSDDGVVVVNVPAAVVTVGNNKRTAGGAPPRPRPRQPPPLLPPVVVDEVVVRATQEQPPPFKRARHHHETTTTTDIVAAGTDVATAASSSSSWEQVQRDLKNLLWAHRSCNTLPSTEEFSSMYDPSLSCYSSSSSVTNSDTNNNSNSNKTNNNNYLIPIWNLFSGFSNGWWKGKKHYIKSQLVLAASSTNNHQQHQFLVVIIQKRKKHPTIESTTIQYQAELDFNSWIIEQCRVLKVPHIVLGDTDEHYTYVAQHLFGFGIGGGGGHNNNNTAAIDITTCERSIQGLIVRDVIQGDYGGDHKNCWHKTLYDLRGWAMAWNGSSYTAPPPLILKTNPTGDTNNPPPLRVEVQTTQEDPPPFKRARRHETSNTAGAVIPHADSADIDIASRGVSSSPPPPPPSWENVQQDLKNLLWSHRSCNTVPTSEEFTEFYSDLQPDDPRSYYYSNNNNGSHRHLIPIWNLYSGFSDGWWKGKKHDIKSHLLSNDDANSTAAAGDQLPLVVIIQRDKEDKSNRSSSIINIKYSQKQYQDEMKFNSWVLEQCGLMKVPLIRLADVDAHYDFLAQHLFGRHNNTNTADLLMSSSIQGLVVTTKAINDNNHNSVLQDLRAWAVATTSTPPLVLEVDPPMNEDCEQGGDLQQQQQQQQQQNEGGDNLPQVASLASWEQVQQDLKNLLWAHRSCNTIPTSEEFRALDEFSSYSSYSTHSKQCLVPIWNLHNTGFCDGWWAGKKQDIKLQLLKNNLKFDGVGKKILVIIIEKSNIKPPHVQQREYDDELRLNSWILDQCRELNVPHVVLAGTDEHYSYLAQHLFIGANMYIGVCARTIQGLVVRDIQDVDGGDGNNNPENWRNNNVFQDLRAWALARNGCSLSTPPPLSLKMIPGEMNNPIPPTVNNAEYSHPPQQQQHQDGDNEDDESLQAGLPTKHSDNTIATSTATTTARTPVSFTIDSAKTTATRYSGDATDNASPRRVSWLEEEDNAGDSTTSVDAAASTATATAKTSSAATLPREQWLWDFLNDHQQPKQPSHYGRQQEEAAGDYDDLLDPVATLYSGRGGGWNRKEAAFLDQLRNGLSTTTASENKIKLVVLLELQSPPNNILQKAGEDHGTRAKKELSYNLWLLDTCRAYGVPYVRIVDSQQKSIQMGNLFEDGRYASSNFGKTAHRTIHGVIIRKVKPEWCESFNQLLDTLCSMNGGYVLPSPPPLPSGGGRGGLPRRVSCLTDPPGTQDARRMNLLLEDSSVSCPTTMSHTTTATATASADNNAAVSTSCPTTMSPTTTTTTTASGDNNAAVSAMTTSCTTTMSPIITATTTASAASADNNAAASTMTTPGGLNSTPQETGTGDDSYWEQHPIWELLNEHRKLSPQEELRRVAEDKAKGIDYKPYEYSEALEPIFSLHSGRGGAWARKSEKILKLLRDEIQLVVILELRKENLDPNVSPGYAQQEAHFNRWTIEKCERAGVPVFKLNDTDANGTKMESILSNVLVHVRSGIVWRQVQGVMVRKIKPEWQGTFEHLLLQQPPQQQGTVSSPCSRADNNAPEHDNHEQLGDDSITTSCRKLLHSPCPPSGNSGGGPMLPEDPATSTTVAPASEAARVALARTPVATTTTATETENTDAAVIITPPGSHDDEEEEEEAEADQYDDDDNYTFDLDPECFECVRV